MRDALPEPVKADNGRDQLQEDAFRSFGGHKTVVGDVGKESLSVQVVTVKFLDLSSHSVL